MSSVEGMVVVTLALRTVSPSNASGVGPEVEASWSGLQGPARAAALRSFYHRSAWLNDPGHLVVRPPLSPAEARLWTSIASAIWSPMV